MRTLHRLLARRFVYKWVQQFLRDGLAGLTDQLGRGARRVPPPPALTKPHEVSA